MWRKVNIAFGGVVNRRTYRENHLLNGSVGIAGGAESWLAPW
jgi:hypothetical protein